MADIVVTAAYVSEDFPQDREVVSVRLAAAVTAGQALYQNTAGRYDLADANGSGTLQFRGIALQAGAAGDVIRMLKRGACSGFTVSGLNADVPLYVSNTAGALADAAGGTSIIAGIVYALTDGTKVAWIEARWTHVWA